MAIIDELLVGLGFEYDPKEMKKFKDDVKSTTDTLSNLAKKAVLAALAITGLTVASTRASDEQGKLADEIGDTVENIDALQFAAQRTGGSAEGMASSLQQLSIRAAEAARGVGSGIEAFGLLGISTTDVNGKLKSTSGLMLEISKEFQGLSRAEQIELADKLGLRDSIRLLQQGPSAIRALITEARELGVTTAEDAKIAAEFQDSLTDLWRVTKQLTRAFVKELAPILKNLVTQITDWWKLNRQMIEQNMPKWVENFTKAIKVLALVVAGFIALRLTGHLIALIALLKGATVATLGLNAAAFLLPLLLGVAAAAFIALIEDAKVFFDGGDSFIGDMIKRFPEWEQAITNVASALAVIADLTSRIFDGWSQLFDLDFVQFFKDLPGFLLDATGLVEVGGGGLIPPEVVQAISKTNSTIVDTISIVVQAGSLSADLVAQEVFNVFQQTAQDLNSAVDQ